jgi:Vault protein inter-alpha-trypsin domain
MTYYLVGLIPVGSTVRDDYPLVQARCHYKVLDVYTIAEVVQDYYSSAPVNRDVEYVFPLPPSAAVCAFKAVIDDDKVIKGIVKEKGEAKKEYTEAVAQGKTAGLLQQEHADGETFSTREPHVLTFQ